MNASFMRPSRNTLGLILLCLGTAVGCDTGSKTVVHTAPPAPTVRTVVVQAPSVPAALGNRSTPVVDSAISSTPSLSSTPTAPPPQPPPATAAQPPAPIDPSASVAVLVPPPLPGPVADVVQLTRGGLDEGVVSEYISNIQEPFALGASQIVYLNDLGVSSNIIHVLMRKAVAIRPESPALAPPSASAPAVAQSIPTNLAPPPVAPTGIPTTTIEGTPPPPPSSTIVVPAPAAQTVVNQQVFYQSLSPYGSWMEVPGYGWCWRPSASVANPTWQPYCDGGSWLWTDAGWYWNSTYTWGWAPYHYGRWHQHSRFGWVWNPGYDWAPAWVAWRSSSSYCGWAPLPPECRWSANVGFSWVNGHTAVSIGFGIGTAAWYATTWDRFGDPHLYHHRLPRHQAERFVRESNVQVASGQGVNIRGNNNTVIINNGISREEVQKHSREEIRRTELRDVNSPAAAQSFANSRPNPSGGRPAEVAVYRPAVPTHASRPPESVLKRPEVSRLAPNPNSGGLTDRIGISPLNSRPLVVPSAGGSLSPNRPANIPSANLAPSSSPGRPAPIPTSAPTERLTQTLPPTTRPGSGAGVPTAVAPKVLDRPSTTPTPSATPSRPPESRSAPIPRAGPTEPASPLGAPSPGSASRIPTARSGSGVESGSRPTPVTSSRPSVIPANPTPNALTPAPSGQSAPSQSAAPVSRPVVIPNASVPSRPMANPSATPAPSTPSAPPVSRQESFRPTAPAPSASFSPNVQARPAPTASQFAPAPAPAPNIAPGPRPAPSQAPSFQPSPRPAPSAAPGSAPSGRPGQRGPIER